MNIGSIYRFRSILGATGCILWTLLGAGSVQAQNTVKEAWYVVTMAGERAGWQHETTVRSQTGGQTTYKTDLEFNITVKRFGQEISMSSQDWVVENTFGQVIEMHKKASLSGRQTLYHLAVQGDQAKMTITTMDKPYETTIPWSKDIIGPYGLQKLQKEKGFQPGTRFTFKSFTFDFSKTFATTTEVMAKQETQRLDQSKVTLIHVQSETDLMAGVKVHDWYDDQGRKIKSNINMMGIAIEFHLSSRDEATQEVAAEMKTDVIKETIGRSNVVLPRPYGLDTILYRFKAKDANLGLPQNLASDTQEVVNQNKTQATVRIRALAPKRTHQKRPLTNPAENLKEYLQPNAFIQSEHTKLKAKALQVVGREKNAWKAAKKLEKFVFQYIKDKNFSTAFASAAEVFEDPHGDCSEHAVLLAAMLRAAGIPSRVAMGYMYLGGVFAGHMWAEAWIDKSWIPVDGVMGIGRVDPTHIRFSTSSLQDGGLADSFASAVHGLGNLDIQILAFSKGKKTIVIGEDFKDHAIKGNVYKNTLYGVSIKKPKGFQFDTKKIDQTGPDFTLVNIKKDQTIASLSALPAAFSFTFKTFKEQLTRSGTTIVKEKHRRHQGRKTLILTTQKNNQLNQLLVLLDRDTCYVLRLPIHDKERDMNTFQYLMRSFRIFPYNI